MAAKKTRIPPLNEGPEAASGKLITLITLSGIQSASRAVVDLFVQAETSAFTVKQMAAHAGISERTFYRYFPTREDVVRPVISLGMQALAVEMGTRPKSESLVDSIIAAFKQSWVVVPMDRSLILFKVMNETETLQAVWRQAVNEGEQQWSQLIAERLKIPVDSDQAILAGAVISTAIRLAFEYAAHQPGADPVEQFSIFLKLLGSRLFVRQKSLA